jgi:uncharacterized protein
VAPDISSLGKPLGVPCIHLGADLLCMTYDNRPAICSAYQADDFCDRIAAPSLEERVWNYLDAFGLRMEAETIRKSLPQLPPK